MINNYCIICLNKNNLLYFPCYYNNCKCKYFVHTQCINKWNIKNNFCIICRKKYNYKYFDRIFIINFFVISISIFCFIYFHPFNVYYNFNYTT